MDNGAFVDCINKKKHTPLHYAAKGACFASILELLENGANINSVDGRDRTPIFKAETPETVKLLLKYGADISQMANIPSTLGKTTLQKFKEERVTAIEYHLVKSRPNCAKVILDTALNSQTDDTLILDLGVFKQTCRNDRIALFHAITGTFNQNLLLHPLLRTFVNLQFQSFSTSYALKCVFPLFLVITLSWAGTEFINVLRCKDIPSEKCYLNLTEDQNTLMATRTDITLEDFILEYWINNHVILFVWTVTLLLFTFLFEIEDLLNEGSKSYARNLINYLEITLLFCSFAFIITSTCSAYSIILIDYAVQFAAWMVFLSWISFAYYIGKFKFGQYVFMVVDVAYNLKNFIIPFMCFVYAFTFGFHTLLYTNEKFSSPYDSYLEVLMMMLGNVEKGTLNVKNEDLFINDTYAFSAQLMFHIFLGLAIYIINNLVIAVTVSKTDFRGLNDRTKIMQTKLNIEHIEWQTKYLNKAGSWVKFLIEKFPNGPSPILDTCDEANCYKVCKCMFYIVYLVGLTPLKLSILSKKSKKKTFISIQIVSLFSIIGDNVKPEQINVGPYVFIIL